MAERERDPLFLFDLSECYVPIRAAYDAERSPPPPLELEYGREMAEDLMAREQTNRKDMMEAATKRCPGRRYMIKPILPSLSNQHSDCH